MTIYLFMYVQIQGREVKVEFLISEDGVTLVFKKVKGKIPLTEVEAKEVSVFLKAYYKKIIEKWETVFIFNKKVTCDVISKRLNRKA